MVDSERSPGAEISIRVVVAVITGGAAFVIGNLLQDPLNVTLGEQFILSILVGGVTLLSQFFQGFQRNLSEVGSRMTQYVADSETRLDSAANQASAQTDLISRNLEERLAGVIGDQLKIRSQDEPLVRELAHSLGTPLAQMETTLLLADTPDARLLSAVQVCKAFVIVFREMATLARDTQAWEPDSLPQLIRSIGPLYAARAGKVFALEVDLPAKVQGYSNNYLVAILLPLLENAIEASEPDGRLRVALETVDRGYEIRVTNPSRPGLQHLPPKMFEPEWSSKNTHEGLGLATVSTLLRTIPDASISADLVGGATVFTVFLPKVGDR